MATISNHIVYVVVHHLSTLPSFFFTDGDDVIKRIRLLQQGYFCDRFEVQSDQKVLRFTLCPSRYYCRYHTDEQDVANRLLQDVHLYGYSTTVREFFNPFYRE